MIHLWWELFFPATPCELPPRYSHSPWVYEHVLELRFDGDSATQFAKGDKFSIHNKEGCILSQSSLLIGPGGSVIYFSRFPRTEKIFAVYSHRHGRDFLVFNPAPIAPLQFPNPVEATNCVWDRQVSLVLDGNEGHYNPLCDFHDRGPFERLHFAFTDSTGNTAATVNNLCPSDSVWRVRTYKSAQTNITLSLSETTPVVALPMNARCSSSTFTFRLGNCGEEVPNSYLICGILTPPENIWITAATVENPTCSIKVEDGTAIIRAPRACVLELKLKFEAGADFYIDPAAYRVPETLRAK
jgi:hypothetical protein